MNSDNVTYFDSFGVKHIPEELKNFKGNWIYLVLDLLILFGKVKVC